tara:strand:- start:11958 stop:12374 length:417 start_codon:yes stop_codon:yes gene_type:complete
MNDLEKRAKTKRILDILSDYFRAYTDEELAEKLGSTRTSIAKWRFTNQVPKKILVEYSNILDKNILLVNEAKSDIMRNIKDTVYYTPFEIAEKFKIPALDIISFIHDGTLKAYNFGNGNYRVSETQLKNFLKDREESI